MMCTPDGGHNYLIKVSFTKTKSSRNRNYTDIQNMHGYLIYHQIHPWLFQDLNGGGAIC